MLVDLPEFFRAPRQSLGAMFDPANAEPERLAQGVYRWNINFAIDLRGSGYLKTEYPFMIDLREKTPEELAAWNWNGPQDFGVCDTWNQIVNKWPTLITDPRRFLIVVTPIVKSEQSPQGGWRWHKWGDYIGDKTPQHEYLYDEDDTIEMIHVFSIVEMKDYD